jgi:hypothetical protein
MAILITSPLIPLLIKERETSRGEGTPLLTKEKEIFPG